MSIKSETNKSAIFGNFPVGILKQNAIFNKSIKTEISSHPEKRGSNACT